MLHIYIQKQKGEGDEEREYINNKFVNMWEGMLTTNLISSKKWTKIKQSNKWDKDT